MPVPMVNVVELAHAVELLDRIASSSVVDRAMRAAGISRKMLKAGSGFLPYVTEVVVLESVARALGEPHVGARIGQAFDYSAYGGYARYVLGARDLAGALVRALHALPLLHPGSDVDVRMSGNHLVVGFASGLQSVVGHRHIEEGAIFVMKLALQHFLGFAWRPDWIEVVGDRTVSVTSMEDMVGTSVRPGAAMAAIAVRMSDLGVSNPIPPAPEEVVALSELPSLMGVTHPRTMADAVRQMLRTQLIVGELSEDGVSRRLSIGPRTLQRVLKSEGTSFREVKARFVEERARALLVESDLAIDEVARTLGYSEPNSFRRAFRSWTGLSPSTYREAALGGSFAAG